jgi:F-type H+-transporting ATPase subunit alpha
VSAYIPTNVISITDGQIYLETEAFNAGIRPAMNPGLSVSRVGGAAQYKAMRKIAAPLRTELAQYRELASFAQFSADLDKDTQYRLRHGERIVELLKQPQYTPTMFEHMILIFFAAANHILDDVNVEDIKKYEVDLIEYFEKNHADIITEIKTARDLSDDLAKKLKECLQAFKQA